MPGPAQERSVRGARFPAVPAAVHLVAHQIFTLFDGSVVLGRARTHDRDTWIAGCGMFAQVRGHVEVYGADRPRPLADRRPPLGLAARGLRHHPFCPVPVTLHYLGQQPAAQKRFLPFTARAAINRRRSLGSLTRARDGGSFRAPLISYALVVADATGGNEVGGAGPADAARCLRGPEGRAGPDCGGYGRSADRAAVAGGRRG